MSEFVYNTDFKDMHNKNLAIMPWLPHILITYLQKYFQACNPVAKKPKNLRGIITHDCIGHRTYKEAESLLSRMMDILRSCVIGDSMDMLACPPSTYPLFFFFSATKNKYEDSPKEKAANIPKVIPTQDATLPPTRFKGYLANSCADKKIPP